MKQGDGPTLKGANKAAGKTKPVHWDDYTDVNINTNPDAKINMMNIIFMI